MNSDPNALVCPLYYRSEYPIRAEDGSVRARVILELPSHRDAPVSRAFVRHIDNVRELLVTGHLSPDAAYRCLKDTSWIGKAVGGGVARGMRALR